MTSEDDGMIRGMAREISMEEVEALARQQVENRVSAVRGLIEASESIATLSAQLEEMKRSYASHFKTATDAGWTMAELKSFGLQPEPKQPRRSRAQRASAPTSSDSTGHHE